MRLSLTSKPKTVTERAEAIAEQAVEFARGVPERLDTSRKRALAVAGGAASAAAGFIFWRSRQDEGPSVHSDPAQTRTPWKATPPPPSPAATEPAPPKPAAKKPVTSTKAAATNASGSRSK